MNVLITRVGALGDVLHALPAVAALRAAQPAWTIGWAVDPRWAPLLVNGEGQGPVVNSVHLADTKLWSRAPFSPNTFRSVAELRRELRDAHYDIAIDMQGTLRSAVITRFSGAPIRAGYSDPREAQAAWFYTRKLPRRSRHVVEQGFDLLRESLAHLGAPPVTASPSRVGHRDANTPNPDLPAWIDHAAALELPHEPWADNWAAEEAPEPHRLALLAPGAGWGAKQWPAANFAALARDLRARGFDVAVTAPRKDNETANRVVDQSGGAARLLVCNVTGLIAITRRAALAVGGDSGPIHLAAALGVPLVALFGPTDPARNGPWGPGVMRVLRDAASVTSYKHVDAEDPGLTRVSVEQVLHAALEIVSPAGG